MACRVLRSYSYRKVVANLCLLEKGSKVLFPYFPATVYHDVCFPVALEDSGEGQLDRLWSLTRNNKSHCKLPNVKS